MTDLCVIGTGYVGLVTGVCMAGLGHHVVCVDNDAVKIAALASGTPTIHELGLPDALRSALDAGRLSFTSDTASAASGAEIIFLCLPTPAGSDGHPDLSALRNVAEIIGPALRPGAVVVNKSTMPIGGVATIEELLGRDDVSVVSNPEFLREGTAIGDFMQPDRIVIGGSDVDAIDRVATLYSAIEAPVVRTDPASAETIKYVSNALLATKLSFANAVAAICEQVTADASQVLHGVGLDHRIGPHFLRPGPGWGGSCFPKDTEALVTIANEAGYDFALLRSAIATNDKQLQRTVDKVVAAAGGNVADQTIAIFGLAFKAGTDDVRESPALAIATALIELGATIQAYDPVASVAVDGITMAPDPYAAAHGAAVIAVLTEWPEFASLDLAKLAAGSPARTIVDARVIIDRAAAKAAGFAIDTIGVSAEHTR